MNSITTIQNVSRRCAPRTSFPLFRLFVAIAPFHSLVSPLCPRGYLMVGRSTLTRRFSPPRFHASRFFLVLPSRSLFARISFPWSRPRVPGRSPRFFVNGGATSGNAKRRVASPRGSPASPIAARRGKLVSRDSIERKVSRRGRFALPFQRSNTVYSTFTV